MNNGITSIWIYNWIGEKVYECEFNSSSKFVENLMGDCYVLIDFYDESALQISAFCYVIYNNKPYFIKEDYHSTREGKNYHYEIKFVPFEQLLSKFIFFRQIDLSDGTHYEEADFSVCCDINTVAQMWNKAVQVCASSTKENTVFANMLTNCQVSVDITDETLVSYSFSGVNLYSALSTIVNGNSDNTQEYWITIEKQSETQFIPTVHIGRCELGETIQLKDEVGGEQIYSIEFQSKWENITNSIIPMGAERNMDGGSGTDTNSNLEVSYGKRIRLQANTNYTVKNADGESVTITTNSRGGFGIEGVTSKIEEVKTFEDIYPQCHYQVIDVVKNDNDIYTVELKVKDEANKELLTRSQMFNEGLCPYSNTFVQDGETLKMVFETGALSGQEFEVSNDYCKVYYEKDPDTGRYAKYTVMKLQIKPNTIGDQQIPLGNFAPKASTVYGEGDTVALFGMKMPDKYVTLARQELAQSAYTYLEEVAKTRPAVNVTAYVNYFKNINLGVGSRVAITSYLFGTGDATGTIVSRVTKIEHDLYFTSSLDFTVSSSQVTGRLSRIESSIADVTADVRGVKQEAKAISRRGYRDAQEMSKMLESLTTQMMLVGDEQNQFVLSSTITPNYNDDPNSLDITYGVLQHTQEPYISNGTKGVYTVNAFTLTTDSDGAGLDNDTPYYLYVVVDDINSEEATPQLCAEQQSTENYLLVGILSSVFENQRTFNRTNGYSSIAGGTITTEVLQDASKKLIIDFPNATITARNGGKFVGNFDVTTSSGAQTSIGTGEDVKIEQSYYVDSANPWRLINWKNSDTVQTSTRYVSFSANHESETDGRHSDLFALWGVGNEKGLENYVYIYIIRKDNRLVLNGYDLKISFIITKAWNLKFELNDTNVLNEDGTIKTLGNNFFLLSVHVYDGSGNIVAGYDYPIKMNETGSYDIRNEIVVPTAQYPSEYSVYIDMALGVNAEWQSKYNLSPHFFILDGSITLQQNGATDGGALSANLIVLKNAAQKVVGGLSGLADNVGMWLGGTYSDAVLNPTKLPFYVSKHEDGNGSKFGPLQIEEDGTLKIATSDNTVYITNKKISTYTETSFFKSFTALSLSKSLSVNTIGNSYNINLNNSAYTIPPGAYTVSDNKITVSITTSGCSKHTVLHISSSFNSYLTRIDGTTTAINIDTTFNSDGTYILCEYDALSVAQELSTSVVRQTVLNIPLSLSISGTKTIDVTLNVSYNGGTISGSSTASGKKQIILGSDGLAVQNGTGQLFVIKNTSSTLTAQMLGLPTSSTGLSVGQLYQNSGYIRIKTE